MDWLNTWIEGIKLGEVYKKVIVLVLLIAIVFVVIRICYVVILSLNIYGMISVVRLRVYIWFIIGFGFTLLMMSYLSGNFFIEINWKVLVIRVIPLPVFFIKVMGSWLLLYVIILYRMIVLCG
jgi:hypothetical protein